jgi:hypothetical protein
MSGTEPIPVVLKLSDRAHRLMEEEFPDTTYYIKKNTEGAIYNGAVYSFEGIGRFILGLLGEVEVVEPLELTRYIEKKVRNWIDRSYSYVNM